ncbi:MAG: nucleotide-binding protein, partial [Bacteroidaceae bacterium]|nr:nucleotide-binding protein [Bacteroidaceae bacterium]
MKKFFQTVMAVALGVFALSSCSDVPAPYEIPGMNDDDDPAVVIEPAGSGTAADPFNVAAAVAKCQEIGATESTDKYYVKGVIKKITLAFDESSVNSYGNATFDMVDDLKATTSFKAFQVYYLEGKKCFVPNTIAVGDTVVVYGPIYNYGGNTPETAGKGAAYICQHNGAGNVTPDVPAGDPKGTGTLADPFNAVAANAYTS